MNEPTFSSVALILSSDSFTKSLGLISLFLSLSSKLSIDSCNKLIKLSPYFIQ